MVLLAGAPAVLQPRAPAPALTFAESTLEGTGQLLICYGGGGSLGGRGGQLMANSFRSKA